MSSHVKRTMRKEVLGGLGGFGATFDLSQLNMKAPVLVSGTDGVGTKLKLAIDNDKHDTIGTDAVAMCKRYFDYCAEPLYFLDYIATNKVVPEVIEQIVKGVSDGCEETNTALIGEKHEGNEYDLAGFAVGAVENAEPLYFLDYIATNKVVPEVIEQIVKGVSDGCEETNTALIGGES